ncbi:MAG TPA: hypothetical protein VHH73_02825 [Verrucomicrobiae bacterium]|nr:hypothetical protein [Verrucomicrobiae bacterium]
MMTRIILNARFGHYGFFMMPLALLFWFHLLVVESARPASGGGDPCCPLVAIFSGMLLFGVVHLGMVNLEIYARKTYAVGTGRDRFYTAPPDVYPAGFLLNSMIEWYDKMTPDAKTLLVFPEGIAVNYHLRVPTPLAELEFQPLSLGYVGSPQVLAELNANPPAAVILFAENLQEFSQPYFGADDTSGRDILHWLNEHYSIALRFEKSDLSITGDAIDLLVPKTADDNRAELLPAEQ